MDGHGGRAARQSARAQTLAGSASRNQSAYPLEAGFVSSSTTLRNTPSVARLDLAKAAKQHSHHARGLSHSQTCRPNELRARPPGTDLPTGVSDRYQGNQVPSSSRWNAQQARVLECWVNERLAKGNAACVQRVMATLLHNGPPGQDPAASYVNGPKKTLIALGVSREQLLEEGLEHDQIDRLYRALYTYSVGAHEVFHDVMKHSLSGPSIISALWRAYLGLLESASNDMYGMALSLVQRDTERQVFDLVTRCNERFLVYGRAMHQFTLDQRNLSEALERVQGITRDQADTIDSLHRKVDALANAKDADLMRYNFVYDEAQALRMKNTAMRCHLFQQGAHIRKVDAQMRALASEASTLTMRMLAMNTDNKSLTSRLAKAEAQVADLLKAQSESRDKYHDMSLRLQNQLVVISSLNEARARLQTDLDKEQTGHRATTTAMEQLQKALDARCAQFADLQDRLIQQTDETAARCKERDEYLLKLAEAQTVIGGCQTKIREQDKHASEVCRELAVAKDTISVLEQDMSVVARDRDALGMERKETQAAMEQQQTALRDLKAQMQTAHVEHQADRQELTRERMKIAELKMDLAKSHQQVDELLTSLQNTRKAKDARIHEINLQKQDLQRQVAERADEISALNVSLARSMEQILGLNAALDASRLRLDKSNEEIDSLKAVEADLKRRLEIETDLVHAFQAQVQSAQGRIERQRDHIQALSDEVDTRVRQLEDLHRAIQFERAAQHELATRSRSPGRGERRRSFDYDCLHRFDARHNDRQRQRVMADLKRSRSMPHVNLSTCLPPEITRPATLEDDQEADDDDDVAGELTPREPMPAADSPAPLTRMASRSSVSAGSARATSIPKARGSEVDLQMAEMTAKAFTEMRSVVQQQAMRIAAFEEEMETRVDKVEQARHNDVEQMTAILKASEAEKKRLAAVVADLTRTRDEILVKPMAQIQALAGENEGLRARIAYLEHRRHHLHLPHLIIIIIIGQRQACRMRRPRRRFAHQR
ncbi:hypothetical protein PBRA_004369 [Plasmodiophora brassicae]|uniref:Uncharacterized protein n=1 Tax=Plasmodiophora brassicae TaxID=37360 RepID=A0A0G4IKC9_PLABS|nr:hypothetical protein PBRA_004369 [Plasmodiophora brassicae]